MRGGIKSDRNQYRYPDRFSRWIDVRERVPADICVSIEAALKSYRIRFDVARGGDPRMTEQHNDHCDRNNFSCQHGALPS